MQAEIADKVYDLYHGSGASDPEGGSDTDEADELGAAIANLSPEQIRELRAIAEAMR